MTLCLPPDVITAPGRTHCCWMNGGLPSEWSSAIKFSRYTVNTEQLPSGSNLAFFNEVAASYTHMHAHTLSVSNFLLCQWDMCGEVCKRFTSPNPALKVVYNILYRLISGGKKCWVKAELRAACAVTDISEPSVCKWSKVQPNELKFLRNPGFQPQSWKHYVDLRPSSLACQLKWFAMILKYH